jgi:nitrite reductase (NADH) large subunit
LQSSSPLFGKKLQAVATCAGIRYAKDAMQDSVQLGMKLERILESIELPATVTLAVSASPRDEADVMRKDAGLIGTPGGWELSVKKERLFSGLLEEEAVTMTVALLQYYREDAFYLETLPEWIKRVGLIHVREEVFKCKTDSQKGEQKQVAALMR